MTWNYMIGFRLDHFSKLTGHVVFLCAVLIGSAVAAPDRLITTLTQKQIVENEGTYFNCDHEGKLGCLVAACRAKTMSKEDAATVQFLYRDVTSDFPKLITRSLTTCFARAGGSIRSDRGQPKRRHSVRSDGSSE